MRKVLSILLVLIVCASMMTLTAFAASGSMSVNPASKEMAAGESTTVTVSLTSNPGVMAYTVKPSVPEGFSIKMVSAGMDGIWTIGKNAQWDSGSDSTYTGAILSVTVTADADVKPGNYTISFSAAGANYDEEDVSFGSCSVTITVPKPACNHVWDDGEITTAPGCETTGVKVYTCTVEGCGEKKTDTVSAIGHNYGEWTVSKAATCTEKGEETRSCNNDASHVDTRETDPTGHNYGEWTVSKAATCTEKGEETRVCANDEMHIDTRETTKDHALNSYGKDASRHWALCDDCDYVGDKEAHSYDYNGVCECGATKPVEKDPNLDDVPKTGDITPYIAMTFVFVVALAGAAFALKRKAAK